MDRNRRPFKSAFLIYFSLYIPPSPRTPQSVIAGWAARWETVSTSTNKTPRTPQRCSGVSSDNEKLVIQGYIRQSGSTELKDRVPNRAYISNRADSVNSTILGYRGYALRSSYRVLSKAIWLHRAEGVICRALLLRWKRGSKMAQAYYA